MKISIVSDLHSHGGKLPLSFDVKSIDPADVLVVAGDLGTRDNWSETCRVLKEVLGGKFGSIVAVKGNHDYYTVTHYFNDAIQPSVDDNFVKSVPEKSEGSPDRVVDFICTPMWSPIKRDELVSRCMNDYGYIPGFTTHRCTELFFENLEWLEKQAEASRKAGHDIVIVTHHLPRRELIDPRFDGDEINEAFCVIDDESERRLAALAPRLWIHGHSHNFSDITVDGVRYVRNPYGYEYGIRREDTGYRHSFTVVV